jgi:hypothetical protein
MPESSAIQIRFLVAAKKFPIGLQLSTDPRHEDLNYQLLRFLPWGCKITSTSEVGDRSTCQARDTDNRESRPPYKNLFNHTMLRIALELRVKGQTKRI